jgi:hypothetical protein
VRSHAERGNEIKFATPGQPKSVAKLAMLAKLIVSRIIQMITEARRAVRSRLLPS